MSCTYAESTPSEETTDVSPPRYEANDITTTSKPGSQPIVIPQSTNLFYIKSFSPFARCYSPALADLPSPIPESEFLGFIDRLNHVFISLPIFQVAHITGGALLGSQVLPAQVVGGALQVTSVMASASVSFLRVRKFIKTANAEIFASRDLVVKVLTTKKMMASIGFTETDEKGKLKLPPLETVHDLGLCNSASSIKSGQGIPSAAVSGIKDPRLLRLQALEGYIAPLTFDVPEPAPESAFSKYSQAPLRWANKRQSSRLEKAEMKYNKKADSKTSSEVLMSEFETKGIEKQIETQPYEEMIFDEVTGREIHEAKVQQTSKNEEIEKQDTKVKGIYNGVDKKMSKAYKKEEKIANRILWIVIEKRGGSGKGVQFI